MHHSASDEQFTQNHPAAAGVSSVRPVQRSRLVVRADTGDSKNMKAQNMQPDVPEQM